jgi:hypothetical protein
MTWRFLVIHINKERETKGFTNLDAVVTYLDHTLKASEHYTYEGGQPRNRILP